MPKQQSDKKATKPQEIKFTNEGADLPTFYSNFTLSMASQTRDIRMRLGQVQLGTDEVVLVKPVADVYMTAHHARVLVAKLTEVLDQIEATGAKKAN